MKKAIFGFMALAIAFTFGTMMSCSEKVEERPAMEVSALNDSIMNMVGDTVAVQGTVESICQETGMCMKLAGAEFACKWDSTFDQAWMGQMVRVEGIVCEDVITREMLESKLAELRAAAADTTATDSTAVEEAKPCCEGKCQCGMDTTKLVEMLADSTFTQMSKYYIQVISCKPAAPAEEAK